MGIVLPQLAPASEDRVSGATFVGGGLRFDHELNQYLTRTPGSAGNRNVWTWSAWVKKSNATEQFAMFSAYGSGSNAGYGMLWFQNNGKLYFHNWDGQNNSAETDGQFRNTGWYHIVAVHDENQVSSEKMRFWVNGTEQSLSYNLTGSTAINDTIEHRIGMEVYNSRKPYEGNMAQIYLVDGLAIGPEYFGYTDPLTNTWRPKKFRAEGTTFNDGRVFSSNVTGANNPTNGFNGSLANYMINSAGATPMVLTATFRNVHSFRYYTSNSSAHDVSFNGGTAYRDAPGTGWRTIPDPPSTITSISWIHSNTAATAQVEAVEINGEILLDSTTRNLAFGTNGFYLPMDGNSPIGEDQSGNGNNWTPVNFGGSADITKATGALPILNTANGGTVAASGVFGSEVSKYYTILNTSGGGNPYIFEDLGNKPRLSFVRGATYTFDWSAASGHPLRFATAADAAGSTEYTDGTDVTGNVTTITVPHDAPDTLYYYCNVHNGMGNSISVTTDETKADPYAWKCTLAIPLVGVESDHSGDVNCTTTNKTTASDNLTFSGPGDMFYGNNAKLTGNGSTNSRVTFSSGCLAMGTGDFTIEFWGHFTATGDQGNRNARILTPQSESGSYFQFLSSTTSSSIQFKYNGGGSSDITISNSLVENRTRHFVYQRTGTTGQLIVDGVLYDTGTDNVDYPDVAYQIGRYDASNGGASLYMADLRAYTGIQKYSTTGKSVGDQVFIPASTNPDILPNTPSGVAFKSQLSDSERGSVSFDGSGDSLTITAHSDLDLSSGDFTVEGFVYPQRSQEQSFVTNWNSGGQFQVQMSSSGTLEASWAPYSTGVYAVTGSTPIRLNSWSHFAYTRSGNTFELFLDGVSQGTQTSSANGTTNNNIVLGENGGNGGRDLQGFLSNVRIIKGTALYTSNFIPPSEPLTNVTNTKLLCCQSSRSAADFTVCPDNLTGSINDGTIWGDNFRTNNEPNMIQGSGGAFAGTTDGSNYTTLNLQSSGTRGLVWSAPSPITVSTSLRIYWRSWTSTTYNTGYVYVNGIQKVTAPSNVNTWIDLSFTGTLYELELRSVYNSGGGHHIDLAAIEVDGVVLQQNILPGGDSKAVGFSPFNDIDAARGKEGVYAVMNPLGKGSNVTLSKNNLRAVSGSSGNDKRSGYCNMAVPATGSYYCEATIGATNGMVGIANADYFRLDNIPGCIPNSYAYYENGNKYLGDCNAVSYGDSFTTGDVIGMGIDRGTLTFYKNGVSQGPAMKNLDGRYFFGFGSYNNIIDFNFGQKPFKFGPPRGHQPITSSTIRETSLEPRPNKYCAPMIWTGSSLNVSESRTITTERADFIPDLVWVKTRTGGSEPPALYDSVRGDGTGNKRLLTDRANAESTFSPGVSADLSGFVKGGFTVNGTNGHINGGTSYTHAGWMWKAGGKHNTFNIDDVGYANASDVNMSVGSLNSTMLRQDSNYANASNFSEDTSGLTFTRMFNGTMGSGDVTASVCLFSPYGNSTNTTWTAPTVINNITKLRIYVDMSGTASGGAFEVNGRDYRDYLDSAIYGQITSGEDGWVTIPETYLSTIRFGRNSSNTIAVGICAVEVNDQILIDNQITAPNFPSIANDGCSVGTKNGFSIVTYTGNGSAAQLAHGLGDYPDFILHKFRTASSNWSAWTPFLDNNTRVIWNDNDGMASSSSFNQNTKHTFYVHSGHNDNTVQMIAYCWKNVPGVQKFGQYKGTGSDLGAYIDCGFKPAIVITKAYSTNSVNNNDWIIKDTARDTYNPTTKNLLMNKTDTELSNPTNTSIDITDNGFKLYNDVSGYSNYSGGAGTWDYIYMAFAEQPAFNLYGALSNAR